MSTMCIDIRRADENYVCIYQADHNHFKWSKHLGQSSWNDTDPSDDDGKFYYNYFLVAKDRDYEGIERFIYSSHDKKHMYDTLNEINTKRSEAIFYSPRCYDYRVIRVPIYKYSPFKLRMSDGKIYEGNRQSINILGSEYKLYCPVSLNKKYKVYGNYINKRKKDGSYYWTCPRYLKGA